MEMKILLMVSVLLEVGAISLCISPIKNYFISKMFYNEYMADLNKLVEEMKGDGIYEECEEVNIDKLVWSMNMQLADAKLKMYVGIIGLIIMGVFLIRSLMMLF